MARTKRTQCFAENASFVLIGMRCAGKSSLASMAAKAYGWQVIDEKWQFQRATGLSVAGYIDKYGMKAYCTHEVQILGSLLAENQRSSIIVCSSSCVETQAGRDLLHEYSSILPIIHVMRDANVLQTYLESKWTGNVVKVLRSQEPVYLACSNLTFFNTDDPNAGPATETSPGNIFEAVTPISDRPTSPSLSLKHVESDFIRFLGCIYGRAGRAGQDDRLSNEDDSTYALDLPFEDLKRTHVELESLTGCADMLQIRTDTLLMGFFKKENHAQTWWEYIAEQLAYLRRHTTQPILYHTILPSDCSQAQAPTYFDLIQFGLRLGAEFITLDLTQNEGRLQAITRQKGDYVFIGRLHDSNPTTTGGWLGQPRLSLYDKAVDIGCDIIHLTQPAMKPADNDLASCFRETVQAKGPLLVSAYNTGRLGRPSQCFNKVLTIVRHPSATEYQTETITVSQAQAALFTSFHCEPMSFFVVGATVCYSLAPILHNFAFEQYGMPHKYSIRQTDSLDIVDTIIRDNYLGGFGLSAPFKTSIIQHLCCMSPEAQTIGAVNTVMPVRYWDEDGIPPKFSIPRQRGRAGPIKGLYGENTDWKAIHSCALRYLSTANAITSLSTALVVGAGGMARAAIYAMIKAGVKHICIYNRTYEHAIDLVNHFESLRGKELEDGFGRRDVRQSKCAISITTLKTLDDPWPGGMRFPTVIVNCSPIPGDKINFASDTHQRGVGPEPAVSIPDAWLRSPTGGVYMELAYNSLTSSPELLRICAEDNKGWVGVAGLEIFVEVASAQFELWTGRRAPKHLMKNRLAQHLQELQE